MSKTECRPNNPQWGSFLRTELGMLADTLSKVAGAEQKLKAAILSVQFRFQVR